MTAAIGHLRHSSLRGRTVRFLTGLALVLPVPLCAALGLSLPLPATVERIAAKLVPFANSSVLATKDDRVLGARGTIVHAPGEPGADARSAADPSGSLAALRPRTAGGRGVRGGTGAEADGTSPKTANDPRSTTTAKTAGKNGSSPKPREDEPGSATPVSAAPAPTESANPPKDGGNPKPPPTTPPVVDTATGAANTAVETATNTASSATSAATDAATGAAGAVGGVVDGVVGPVLP
jgi:hypothetical protein